MGLTNTLANDVNESFEPRVFPLKKIVSRSEHLDITASDAEAESSSHAPLPNPESTDLAENTQHTTNKSCPQRVTGSIETLSEIKTILPGSDVMDKVTTSLNADMADIEEPQEKYLDVMITISGQKVRLVDPPKSLLAAIDEVIASGRGIDAKTSDTASVSTIDADNEMAREIRKEMGAFADTFTTWKVFFVGNTVLLLVLYLWFQRILEKDARN